MAKTASKMWLAKFAAMFTHRTRLACNNACYTDKITSLLLIQEKPKNMAETIQKTPMQQAQAPSACRIFS